MMLSFYLGTSEFIFLSLLESIITSFMNGSIPAALYYITIVGMTWGVHVVGLLSRIG